MSGFYLGEIRMFGFGRAPQGWLLCDGRLYSISEYEALFNLIGTTYGGDGQVTFAVPDLRGRAPMHQGTGQGLTSRVLGERAGVENVTLLQQNLPAHTHPLFVTTSGTRSATAAGSLIGSGEADLFNRDTAHGVNLAAGQIGTAGNTLPHQNMQPSLCVNFCIAVAGELPQRG